MIITTSLYAYDLSQKHYLGFTYGITRPFYKTSFQNALQPTGINLSKLAQNFGLTLGTNNQQIGAQLDFIFLNSNTYTAQGTNNTLSFRDIILMPNLAYNFLNYQDWTFKALFGIGYINSVMETQTIRMQNSIDVRYVSSYEYDKIIGKLGLGAQYACTDYLSLSSFINYLKPINHLYINYILYANIGLNLHF